MTKAIKIVEWKHNFSNTHAADNKLRNTDTHRLSVSLQYAQGSIADQRISTTNNTNVGPCKLTTQMLNPTADQKTRITVNITIGRT